MLSTPLSSDVLGKDGLSNDDVFVVCEFYGIRAPKRCIQNGRGLVNSVYEFDEAFFLGVYRRRTRDQLEAIADVACDMDDAIPMPKPIKGSGGYSFQIASGFTLLTPRLPGVHYVGVAHTEKEPIPTEMHRSLAAFFWELQKRLSAVSQELKMKLESSSVMNIGEMPTQLPQIVRFFERYAGNGDLPKFRYPDLIHDDLERQNILSRNGKITGLVDLDSLRTGDILYEFGHFLFNFVLCDPGADFSVIDLYINELVKAGIIEHRDIPALYGHIFSFVVSDVIEFQQLSENPIRERYANIDMGLLLKQYDRALALASAYFSGIFSM